jgi:Lrp/AsnC family transcriptional regulator for asnA, asnC and gidA
MKENCIKPFVKIAQELGVTEGTVRQRTKKLVDSGVIRKFTIDVDPINLGLPIVAFLILSVSAGRISEVVDALSKIDNIVEIHQIHTFGDLLVKVRSSTLEDLGTIIAEKVRPVKSVTVNNVVPVLKIWKDSTA